MKYPNLILVVTALSLGVRAGHAGVDADPKTISDATLTIHSVRINRSKPEMSKTFGGRFYVEGNPGVNLNLMMKLKDATLLPLGRDAIKVETFIDDTYQNLIENNQNPSYSGQYPAVSEDGSALIFNLGTPRPPAESAERIFVRGKVHARAALGDPLTKTARVPLTVGQGTVIGGYRTVLKSITDNGNESVVLMFNIFGDTTRILKMRVLDTDEDGKELYDPKLLRIQHNQSDSNGSSSYPATIGFTLRSPAVAAVIIEYTVAEKVENVTIPFEAQVDMGATKAGPIQPAEGKGVTVAEKPSLPWPPQKQAQVKLPPARKPFVPKIHDDPMPAKSEAAR